MPKIELTEGTFDYRPIPIFEGVKIIDKEVAYDNLCLLKDVLDCNDVSFQLAYGTLLGAIREHDFIEHDEDIDLTLLDEDKQNLFDALPKLSKVGFQVARYDRRGLMSIIRNGEYIDLYIFKHLDNETRYCSGIIIPEELIIETVDYNFKGRVFKIPKRYEEYLKYEYGDNWRIPVQYFDYNAPKAKRFWGALKATIKEWLPNWLYFKLLKKSEQRMLNRYEPKMEKYLSEHNKV